MEKHSILRVHEILSDSRAATFLTIIFKRKDMLIGIALLLIVFSKPTLSDTSVETSYSITSDDTLCLSKTGIYTPSTSVAMILMKEHQAQEKVMYRDVSSRKRLKDLAYDKLITLSTVSSISSSLSIQSTYQTEDDSCYVFNIDV